MGFPFAKFFQVLERVAPVVLMVTPGGEIIAPFVPLIIKGISDAQQKPGVTGAEKKAYVLQLVADAAEATNVVRPGTLDQTLVVATAAQGIDTVIGTINIIQAAQQIGPPVPVGLPK